MLAAGRAHPDIRSLTLDVGAPLADEIEFLLREELVEVRVYFGVLAAIASGKEKVGEMRSFDSQRHVRRRGSERRSVQPSYMAQS